MLVEMEGMLVHGEKREEGVIEFGDRPSGEMFEDIPDIEILVVPSKIFLPSIIIVGSYLLMK
jgi:hypothetical protein